MKRSVTIITFTGLALIVIIAGIWQIYRSKADLPKSISQLQAEEGIPVEVSTVSRGTITTIKNYLGTVEGALQGDVIPSIMEKIVQIPVRVGDRVKKDDVICQLDTRASLAQYNQLKLAYEDAEIELKRMENLYATGAVSKQMLEKAQLNRDITLRNLEASSEVVTLAAPIDGIVTELFNHAGETTKIGEPVARIADLSKVRIKFQINHDDWKTIKKDNPVFIRTNGDNSNGIEGEITHISRSADPKSRLFSVWIQVDNEGVQLTPGLLVDARVVVREKNDALVIPRDALIIRNEQLGVFTVNEENIAFFSPIKTGDENIQMVEVIQGLTEGQTVVIYGQNNLDDDRLVKIMKSEG